MTAARADADALAESNLFYRRPEWYDQVQHDPARTMARQVEHLADAHTPDARTLLDLGCGTGRDLEALASRFACAGVDLQPALVRYARRVRPWPDIQVGDIRDVRLDMSVNVLTCLGNTLAYVHAEADLAAVFRTFAAHAGPGALLVIATLTQPVVSAPRTSRVDTADLHAEVTISHEWDQWSAVNTLRRHWRLDEGMEQTDCVARRIWSSDELDALALSVGFGGVDVSTSGARCYAEGAGSRV